MAKKSKRKQPETEADFDSLFNEWLATRPQVIQDIGAKVKPWLWYRLNGKRVRVLAFSEDNTVRVALTQDMNPEYILWMEREVFGVSPDDLTECEAPPQWVEPTSIM